MANEMQTEAERKHSQTEEMACSKNVAAADKHEKVANEPIGDSHN